MGLVFDGSGFCFFGGGLFFFGLFFGFGLGFAEVERTQASQAGMMMMPQVSPVQIDVQEDEESSEAEEAQFEAVQPVQADVEE